MSEQIPINKALKQTLSDSDFNAPAIRKLAETLTDNVTLIHEQSADLESILAETLPDDIADHDDDLVETQALLNDRTFTYQQEAEDSLNKSLPGRYNITAILGSNLLSQTFRVFDNNLDREIAVTFLKPKFNNDEEKVDQFIHEARITARLAHPSIPPIFDFDFTEGGLIYFTTTAPLGRSLDDMLQQAHERHVLPPSIRSMNDRVRIMQRVCHALSHAHSKGLYHKDIKPGNIFIDDGGAVTLLHWGNASEDAQQSETHIGTPLYMAPEQARKEPCDHLCDIYAAGATLFHLLILRPPCINNDLEEFWENKKNGDYQTASAEERRQIPNELLTIAEKALAPQAAHRYQLASDMYEALLHYQESTAHTSDQRSALGSYITTLFLVVLTLGGLAYAYWPQIQSDRSNQQEWHTVSMQNWDVSNVADLDAEWELFQTDPRLASTTETVHETPVALNSSPAISLNEGLLKIHAVNDEVAQNKLLDFRLQRPISGSLRITWTQILSNKESQYDYYVGGHNKGSSYHYSLQFIHDTLQLRFYRKNILIHSTEIKNPCRDSKTARMEIIKTPKNISLEIAKMEIHTFSDPDPLNPIQAQQFGIRVNAHHSNALRDMQIQRLAPTMRQDPTCIADAYYQQHLPALALAHYAAFDTSTTKNPRAQLNHYRQGQCHRALGQNDKAIIHYRASLDSFPAHSLNAFAAYALINTLAQSADWEACNEALIEHQAKITATGLRHSLALQLRSQTAHSNASADAALAQLNSAIFQIFGKDLKKK